MKIKVLKVVVSDLNKIKKYFFNLFGILLSDKQVVDYSLATVQNLPPELVKAISIYNNIKSNKIVHLNKLSEEIAKRHYYKIGKKSYSLDTIVAAAIKVRAATMAHQYGKLKLLKFELAVDNILADKKKEIVYTTNYASNKVIL